MLLYGGCCGWKNCQDKVWKEQQLLNNFKDQFKEVQKEDEELLKFKGDVENNFQKTWI